MAAMAMDWPLSREEKKKQVLRLYNEDVQTANHMLHSGEKALLALHKELDAARLTTGLSCAAQSATDISTNDSSEVARLRAVVENASAVLRAILPSQDNVDPIGNAGAIEAAQRRRKSFGSLREQCAPSALKKHDSRRNSQGGNRFHVSFEDGDKNHFQSCADANVADTVEVEPEPMLEPEPSPPIEDIQRTILIDQPQPSASVLHWLFDLIAQQHRSLHDSEHSRCCYNEQEVRDTCEFLHCHDCSAHSGTSRIAAFEAGEDEAAPRCELRLLLDVRGLASEEQDSEEPPLLQHGDTDVLAHDHSHQMHEKKHSHREVREQETGALRESDSLLPQRQGHRRARLRARMHGYTFCDDKDDG